MEFGTVWGAACTKAQGQMHHRCPMQAEADQGESETGPFEKEKETAVLGWYGLCQ